MQGVIPSPWPHRLAKPRRRFTRVSSTCPYRCGHQLATVERRGIGWGGSGLRSNCACLLDGKGGTESLSLRRLLIPGHSKPHYQSSNSGQWSMGSAPQNKGPGPKRRLASDTIRQSTHPSPNPYLFSSSYLFLGVGFSERDYDAVKSWRSKATGQVHRAKGGRSKLRAYSVKAPAPNCHSC